MPRTASSDSVPREALIIDVDGTLCDVRGIRHHVDRGQERGDKRNFHEFHSESIHCPAFPAAVAVARRAKGLGIAVLVVTGREARWSFLTSMWLQSQGVEYDEMYMRPSLDYRPDQVVKAEILGLILREFCPVLALDDRPDIAEVWLRQGIPTSLVSEEGEIGPLEGVGDRHALHLWDRLVSGD